MTEYSRPLHVWPWPVTPEREMLIRAAKATLNSPQIIRLAPAAYGAPGRVLAFETPPFLCQYAPIRPENVTSVASIAAALRFILDGGEDPRWGDEDLLSEWMGGPVRMTHKEDITGRVIFV